MIIASLCNKHYLRWVIVDAANDFEILNIVRDDVNTGQYMFQKSNVVKYVYTDPVELEDNIRDVKAYMYGDEKVKARQNSNILSDEEIRIMAYRVVEARTQHLWMVSCEGINGEDINWNTAISLLDIY